MKLLLKFKHNITKYGIDHNSRKFWMRKTTLLNLIGGIDQDYEGEILFDHQDIRKIKKYCRRHIGFIFQDFNLINWLNVKENYLLAKFFTKNFI